MTSFGRVTQPVGQKLLTNVCVVHLEFKVRVQDDTQQNTADRTKKRQQRSGRRRTETTGAGKFVERRFEIACYPNRVRDWRDGKLTDLRDVLQSYRVYLDVEQGVTCSREDLREFFGTDNELDAVRRILSEGKFQETSRERRVETDALAQQIAYLVASRTVNTSIVPNVPYPPPVILDAMRTVSFKVRPDFPVSQQAAMLQDALVQSGFPIRGAPMQASVGGPRGTTDMAKQRMDALGMCVDVVELRSIGEAEMGTLRLDPSAYGELLRVVKECSGGQGVVRAVERTLE